LRSLLQLGLDRMELPQSAVHPVSRKRTKPAETGSPSSGTPSQTAPASAGAAAEAAAAQTVKLASAALEQLQVRRSSFLGQA
jgi:hypothetical protein